MRSAESTSTARVQRDCPEHAPFGSSHHVALGILKAEGRLRDPRDVPLVQQIRDYVHRQDRRRIYVEAAMRHLKRERSTHDGDYDVVLVGGGVHAAAFLYTLRHLSPGLRVLVVERSAEICSTFAGLGDSVVLNSPTFSRVGLNSNIIQGHFVQVSDFDEVVERPFPTAKHLHQLATMVLFHADADIRFGFDVDRIDAVGDGYVVSSGGRTVRANSVVIANGMGDPKRTSFATDARSERVVFGDDFIARCFRDHAFAALVRSKRVAVVGAGDTANCVIECLVPLVYPNGDYGLADTSRTLPPALFWIGQSAQDVRGYYFANKARYCHSGGVIELFWSGDEPLELCPKVWRDAKRAVRCVPERLVSVSHQSEALALKTETETIEADLVVDCTGRFNRLSSSLFERGYEFVDGDIVLHGGRWDESLERFTPSPRLLEARRVACKLNGEQVFFVGSACPLPELIPDDEATDGSLKYYEQRTSLTNSKWSLEHTIPRSIAFAERFASDFSHHHSR